MNKNTILKIIAGGFFALGSVGAFLPALPTVPFWILAAILYMNSDPVMAQKIFDHPVFGKMVEDFVRYGIIRRKSKIVALTGLISVGAISLYFSRNIGWLFWLELVCLSIGGLFVASRPEARKNLEDKDTTDA